jgi:hypothetical protein
VVRGGAFNNNPRKLRSANRNRNHPTNRNNNIGFRVVASTFFNSPEWPAGIAWRDEAKNGGTRSWPRPRGGPGE